jgi:endonuclease V-like protein UPF0215 family
LPLRTVSAALAYDDPRTGKPVILVVHQAIYVPQVQHNLLSCMQLRLNDVTVNEVPKFLTENPTATTHSILLRGLTTNIDDTLLIPLTISGVTSTFPTRKPSVEECETWLQYELTFDSPDYDPHDTTYSHQEDAAIETLLETGDRVRHLMSVSKSLSIARQTDDYDSRSTALLHNISPVLDDRSFLHNMENVKIISSVKTVSQRWGIDAKTLSCNWGIGLAAAKRTLHATTQRGI